MGWAKRFYDGTPEGGACDRKHPTFLVYWAKRLPKELVVQVCTEVKRIFHADILDLRFIIGLSRWLEHLEILLVGLLNVWCMMVLVVVLQLPLRNHWLKAVKRVWERFQHQREACRIPVSLRPGVKWEFSSRSLLRLSLILWSWRLRRWLLLGSLWLWSKLGPRTLLLFSHSPPLICTQLVRLFFSIILWSNSLIFFIEFISQNLIYVHYTLISLRKWLSVLSLRPWRHCKFIFAFERYKTLRALILIIKFILLIHRGSLLLIHWGSVLKPIILKVPWGKLRAAAVKL